MRAAVDRESAPRESDETILAQNAEVAKANEEFLRETAERVRARMSRTAQDIVEIGLDLIAVKQRIGHGNFLSWIDREFAMSEWTARNFMRVADRFKSGPVPDLPATVLYALADRDTPDEVRTEVIERAAAGETVTVADVRSAKGRRRRQNGHDDPVADHVENGEADCRRVTETFIAMLDLFERDDVDPAVRAAFIVEHFDLAKAGSKLSIKRLSRAIDSLHAVFRSIATDLDTAHRSAPEGRPEPAPKAVVR